MVEDTSAGIFKKKKEKRGEKSMYDKFQTKGSLFISEFTVVHVAFF